jgi:peptidoglycan/LPS O-acetylase OafA/YrhL
MLATRLAIRIAAHIPGRNTGLFVIIAVFTAIAIASCSYYIVEKPFLGLKGKDPATVAAVKMPLAPPQQFAPSSGSSDPVVVEPSPP